jgi:hypothetical protein
MSDDLAPSPANSENPEASPQSASHERSWAINFLYLANVFLNLQNVVNP